MRATVLSNTELGLDTNPGWGGEAPLWFYILKEAELPYGGERLGPVGGRIMAETLVGLLQRDELYLYLNAAWKPAPPIAPATGQFTFVDLLRFYAGAARIARSSPPRAVRQPRSFTSDLVVFSWTASKRCRAARVGFDDERLVESVTSSVSGTAGRLRRPAASGRMWLVSWEEAGPLVTGVVRCNPVDCGPDVGPVWPRRSRAWKARPGAPLSRDVRLMAQLSASRPTLLSVRDRQEPVLRAPGGTA